MSDNKIANTEQCPLCCEEGLDNSCDNMVTFSDTGVKHCFRHGVIGNTNYIQIPIEPKIKNQNSWFIEGEYSDILTRKLKKSTCEFYGYQINRSKNIHISNYYDESGNIVMQQHRTSSKDFPCYGDKDYNKTLWGMNKFTATNNVFVTITEGQIDALSIAQVFDCKYPVVSLPKGAGDADVVIRNCMHWLCKFKYVVLAFDNDKAGRIAVEKSLKEFGPGMVRICKWRRKDANEHLINNEESEIRQIIYNSVEYLPEPVLYGDNLIERLNKYSYTTVNWPWNGANKLFNPIKIPSVISIVAKPKRGKTEFIAALMKYFLDVGDNVAIVSLEQSPEETFLKQVSGQIGKNLLKLTANRVLSDKEKEYCIKYKDRVVIYDHPNFGQTIENIVINIPFMVKALNCKYVVLDNLTSASSSTLGDDRKNIDKAISDLKSLTVKYNFTLFNVMHLKRSNDSILSDQDEQPNVEQIRGTQGVEAFSDVVLGLHRNIKSENELEKNTLYVTVLADRMPGNKTGNQLKLYYDSKTGFLGE